MKSKLLMIVMLTVCIGFGACKKKPPGDDNPKSDKCLITNFTASPGQWTIDNEGNKITGRYAKGAPLGNINPTIQVSKGAKYVSNPANPPFDFSDNKTVTFTVTAENGKSTKTYTASAKTDLP